MMAKVMVFINPEGMSWIYQSPSRAFEQKSEKIDAQSE
jgi:hypothetical protein